MKLIVAFNEPGKSPRSGVIYWIGVVVACLLATARYLVFAASFAGSFSGAFSGDDSGSWSMTVGENGAVTGSGNSSSAGQSFSMTGTVTAAGELTMGSASIGASFKGTITSTGAVTGSWSNTKFGESGKFSGAGSFTTAPVETTTPTVVISNERVFRFAEANYPSLFSGVSTSGTFQAYNYRQYPATGHYLALDSSNTIFLLGPSTGNTIKPLGAASNFASQIIQWEANQSSSSNGATADTAGAQGYSLTGNKHEYLKGLSRSATEWPGRINRYRNNADGSRGAFHSSSAESCSIRIEKNGDMTWMTEGYSSTYSYEKLDGVIPLAAGRARLYSINGATRQVNENSFLEYTDADQSVRRVGFSRGFEDHCVPVATYDLAIAMRFPAIDGRLGSSIGTYKGEVDFVSRISTGESKVPRPGVVKGAPCNADINSLGQVDVTIAGQKVPTFYTRDLDYTSLFPDNGVMFSGNPLMHPQSTYALNYYKPSYNVMAQVTTFIFRVELAPLTYLNFFPAILSADGDLTAVCVTRKVP